MNTFVQSLLRDKIAADAARIADLETALMALGHVIYAAMSLDNPQEIQAELTTGLQDSCPHPVFKGDQEFCWVCNKPMADLEEERARKTLKMYRDENDILHGATTRDVAFQALLDQFAENFGSMFKNPEVPDE